MLKQYIKTSYNYLTSYVNVLINIGLLGQSHQKITVAKSPYVIAMLHK